MNKAFVAKELLAIAKELVAMDFPTQDAMDKYLKEHPDADKSLHHVKETKKEPAKSRNPESVRRVDLDDFSETNSVKREEPESVRNYLGNMGITHPKDIMDLSDRLDKKSEAKMNEAYDIVSKYVKEDSPGSGAFDFEKAKKQMKKKGDAGNADLARLEKVWKNANSLADASSLLRRLAK